jgi:hypothetical protein
MECSLGNGVELEHEGLSDALMGILLNFVLYFLAHSGCLEIASSLLVVGDGQSEHTNEMSKPTRMLAEEKDLHTAAEPRELGTQYLILDIAQCVREEQGNLEWLQNGLGRLANMWTL